MKILLGWEFWSGEGQVWSKENKIFKRRFPYVYLWFFFLYDISCISRRKRSLRTYLLHSTDLKKVEFTVSLCLQLVEVFLKKLNIWDHVDLICHTIKLLFTCISRQRREFEEKPDQEEGQLNESKTIDMLLRSLRERLSNDLSHTMSYHHKSERLARELSVWSK